MTIFDVEIEKIVAGGDGLARAPGACRLRARDRAGRAPLCGDCPRKDRLPSRYERCLPRAVRVPPRSPVSVLRPLRRLLADAPRPRRATRGKKGHPAGDPQPKWSPRARPRARAHTISRGRLPNASSIPRVPSKPSATNGVSSPSQPPRGRRRELSTRRERAQRTLAADQAFLRERVFFGTWPKVDRATRIQPRPGEGCRAFFSRPI